MAERSTVVIGLNAVILAVTDEEPRVLVVKRTGHALAAPEELEPLRYGGGEPPDALPFGPLDPEADRTLELGLRGWVRRQTGFELGYVEQLYTFGDRFRDPRERSGGPRVISVAYLGLVREQALHGSPGARFRDCFEYLPWEDWRRGRPRAVDSIGPAIERWVGAGGGERVRRTRRERADIAFGLAGSAWDDERVLERYELLYEIGAVEEAVRDAGRTSADAPVLLGRPMALDHRRMLATALGRTRGKIKYRPVVFELLPSSFTLLGLQRVVEALAGAALHKGNFRRLVERGGLVEGTGHFDPTTGGRPAELFRFRREVLRERPAPGVGLPGARH